MPRILILILAAEKTSRSPAALAVAFGILLSRIAGLVRERVFAYYLGNSLAAGAFRAALRIPNLLQNLFGEGVLSASFIPVYARLHEEGKEQEAKCVATLTLSLLFLVISLLVVLGVSFAHEMTAILAPGFEGETRELTVRLVAIMFPGTGLLVLSAWCLGILNSHRKFFLSYFAPVIWNFVFITGLVVGARIFLSTAKNTNEFVACVAWSTVAGAALQFLIQLPLALKLNRGFSLTKGVGTQSIKTVIGNFFPALISRGVVQISAYIDQVLASFLGAQAVSAMAYAQTIYLLPVSLFGMSISSAELPEMSRSLGTDEEIAAALRQRLKVGLIRICFFMIPSVVALFLLGDVIVAVLFQNGKFGGSDSRFVWFILIGSTIGLLATTQSRLSVSAFWALRDTKTPMRFAIFRVTLTALFGYLITFPLRQAYSLDVAASAAGLTGTAGIAGWLEFLLIRRSLEKRIGRVDHLPMVQLKYWIAALTAGAVGVALKYGLHSFSPIMRGILVLGVYGIIYLGIAKRLGGEETRAILQPILRRFGR